MVHLGWRGPRRVALHNAILGACTQVLAQYGDDSDAIQSLGLKKRSDRKRPVCRATCIAALNDILYAGQEKRFVARMGMRKHLQMCRDYS